MPLLYMIISIALTIGYRMQNLVSNPKQTIRRAKNTFFSQTFIILPDRERKYLMMHRLEVSDKRKYTIRKVFSLSFDTTAQLLSIQFVQRTYMLCKCIFSVLQKWPSTESIHAGIGHMRHQNHIFISFSCIFHQ